MSTEEDGMSVGFSVVCCRGFCWSFFKSLKAADRCKPLIVDADSEAKNAGFAGSLFVVEPMSILLSLTAFELWRT